MFLADATFEVIEKEDPTDPRVEGLEFKMSLVALGNIREVQAVPDGQFATYTQIVETLMRVLPDWSAFAGQIPNMKRQYHTLRFDSRGEIDELVASIRQ